MDLDDELLGLMGPSCVGNTKFNGTMWMSPYLHAPVSFGFARAEVFGNSRAF